MDASPMTVLEEAGSVENGCYAEGRDMEQQKAHSVPPFFSSFFFFFLFFFYPASLFLTG